MRTFRMTTHRAWKYGALGATAAALLATTACRPGDDKAVDSPSPQSTASVSTSASPSASAASQPSATSSPSGGGETEDGTCTSANTRVRAEFALPAHRDDSKLLLTVTNTGTEPCNLYGYPAVRFGQAQSVPPVFKESKPKSVVVLAPGKEGYAGVFANKSLPDATTETTLTVAFQGRTVNSDTGNGVNVKLPSEEGVVVDSALRVTYWLGLSEPAVAPLFLH